MKHDFSEEKSLADAAIRDWNKIKQEDSVKALVDAAEKFKNKVEKISNSAEFNSIFVMAHYHHAPYQGEKWEEEMDELKAALKPFKEGKS